MKFRSLFFASSLLLGWAMLVSTNKNPNNPPTGNTGAPSETTCQKSGCHGGGNFTGTVAVAGLPDTIQANTTYSLTLTVTANCTRTGFQMTCLDKDNKKCGTFTAGTGSNVITNNVLQRDYIRQSSPKNLANGSASWAFTWKSPAVLPADSVVFYFASLLANSNGGTSGDNAIKSTRKVSTAPTNSIYEPVAFEQLATVFPNPIRDQFTVTLNAGQTGQFQLLDSKGAVLRNETIAGTRQISAADLPGGIYFARITIDGLTALKQLVK